MKALGIAIGLAAALAVRTAAAGPSELAAPTKILADGKPIDVAIGHAAPFVADLQGNGTLSLLVGQFGEGKLAIYSNVGSKTQPRFDKYTWFLNDAPGGRVPSG
jgi:hypothetical protein